MASIAHGRLLRRTASPKNNGLLFQSATEIGTDDLNWQINPRNGLVIDLACRLRRGRLVCLAVQQYKLSV